MIEIVSTKICTKCGIEKSFSDFTKDSNGRNGLRSSCKVCTREANNKAYISKKEIRLQNRREYSKNNKETIAKNNKIYRETNKETLLISKKKYYELNKELIAKKAKEYYISNTNYLLLSKKEYYESNKSIILEKAKEYYLQVRKLYYKTNAINLRPYRSERSAIKRARKLNATPAWSSQEAIKQIYIDCQLISEMTGVLHHVDHILPLKGKLVSGLHVEYNLQIIPATENLSKSNKFIEELL